MIASTELDVGVLKMTDIKMTDQMTGHEIAKYEIAGD